MAYEVFTDAHVETNDPMLGTVIVDFKAGTVTPTSEQEEIALRALVDAGFAVDKDQTVEAKAEAAAIEERRSTQPAVDETRPSVVPDEPAAHDEETA